MKRLFVLLPIGALGLAASLTACVERSAYVEAPPAMSTPPGAAITEAPPTTPPTAPMVASPGPQYVYTPGYWSWQGRWVWVQGSWVVPPYPGGVWVPGKWEHKGPGYVWVAGHWK